MIWNYFATWDGNPFVKSFTLVGSHCRNTIRMSHQWLIWIVVLGNVYSSTAEHWCSACRPTNAMQLCFFLRWIFTNPAAATNRRWRSLQFFCKKKCVLSKLQNVIVQTAKCIFSNSYLNFLGLVNFQPSSGFDQTEGDAHWFSHGFTSSQSKFYLNSIKKRKINSSIAI